MMASQILISVDFAKPQKSRYIKNKTFFPQTKKFNNDILRATSFHNISFNSLLVEVTFQ